MPESSMTGLPAELVQRMPDREVRHFPALVSTEAEARRWAAVGAPSGSLVVADYQAAPRGRGGVVWQIPADGLGFSIILRPGLLEHQEGRMYMWGALAVSDLCESPRIDWPDDLPGRDGRFGAVAVHATIDLLQIEWAVISVMLTQAGPTPSEAIGAVVVGIETWMAAGSTDLRDEYEARLQTIGRQVSAHLIPMGPNGRRIQGRALGIDENCALRIETGHDRVSAVRPHHVGLLEVL